MDIQVNDVSKIYGTGENKVVALCHANMTIHSGDFISIMGPSGSGKSTLLHIISGLDTPTSGKVLYGDTVPVMAIIEVAVVSVAACLLATAIPLRSIAKMNIVESIENVE